MSDICRACGACCASFRVSFYRGEPVPDELVVPVAPFRVAMRGTTGQNPRCVALSATLGEDCACTIYADRPSPCREFTASWEDGQPNPDCDKARARVGLRPLTPEDHLPKRPRRRRAA